MKNENITSEQHFIQICAEWSVRWRCGGVNKLDAIDHLHNVAMAWGLITALGGEDAVQEIMSAHFQDDERNNGSQTKGP